MKYTKRLSTLFSELEKCEKFADVGCDHGYCAAAGKVTSVCCDGLEKIPRDCDLVLIAGMGGEEIVTILKNGFLPRKLLLQPMKKKKPWLRWKNI